MKGKQDADRRIVWRRGRLAEVCDHCGEAVAGHRVTDDGAETLCVRCSIRCGATMIASVDCSPARQLELVA